MSVRNDRIKALARACAAECVCQGVSSDGLLSVDTHVAFLARDLHPTTVDIEALWDILDGKLSWDDRILFDKTFEDSISTWLKVIFWRTP